MFRARSCVARVRLTCNMNRLKHACRVWRRMHIFLALSCALKAMLCAANLAAFLTVSRLDTSISSINDLQVRFTWRPLLHQKFSHGIVMRKVSPRLLLHCLPACQAVVSSVQA